MNFKQQCYTACLQLVDTNIRAIRNRLQQLSESVQEDTKSTAGDKHETGRAMIHLEQENTNKQLQEALEQKSVLETIDISIVAPCIVKGSLVKTNKGYLFISTGLGKVNVDGTIVFALSPQSPLGKLLMGQSVNNTATINNITYVIEEIL